MTVESSFLHAFALIFVSLLLTEAEEILELIIWLGVFQFILTFDKFFALLVLFLGLLDFLFWLTLLVLLPIIGAFGMGNTVLVKSPA